MEYLKKLYQRMYNLTYPKCKNSCSRPLSCCSPEYCQIALERAQSLGVTLEKTGHPRLPLMGEDGCIAEPYLRPLCTLYACSILSFGVDLKDPQWTQDYWELRHKIDRLELKTYNKGIQQ